MQRMLAAAAIAVSLTATGDALATTLSCPGGYAPRFWVEGAVTSKKTFSLADLKAFPSTRLTVTWYSGRDGFVTGTYTGVLLLDLLNSVGIVNNPAQRNDQLRKSVVVAASDCYESTLALGELLPQFGAEPVLLAYADGDGRPLGDGEGMARLIVPGDKAGGRSVFNVRRIAVRTPGPGPQTVTP